MDIIGYVYNFFPDLIARLQLVSKLQGFSITKMNVNCYRADSGNHICLFAY